MSGNVLAHAAKTTAQDKLLWKRIIHRSIPQEYCYAATSAAEETGQTNTFLEFQEFSSINLMKSDHSQ